MILQQLELSNYKQYGRLQLEFREGLVGIIGKNGAGKSTLFEAILYCLFGRDESNKALVRSSFIDDPKANVELALTFAIGEKLYRVKREFRGKAMAVGAELYQNDQLIAKGLTAVNDELVKLLHMERDAFKRSVFSGQKELSELSDTSGEARKKMVRKMLGLDTLDEVQGKMGIDRRDLLSRISGQRQNLLSDAELESLSEHIKTQTAALKKKQAELKQANQELERVEKVYNAQKDQFLREEQRLNRHHALERSLAQAREKWDGLAAQKQNLEAKLVSLNEQKTAAEREQTRFSRFEADKQALHIQEDERQKQLNKDTVSARIQEHRQQLSQLQPELERLRLHLQEKEATGQALREKQEAVQTLERDMELKRNALRELEKQIGGIGAGIRERQEKLTSLRALGKEGSCPTCLQPLLEGYERVLLELEQQIQALQQKELQQLEVQKKQITEEGLQLKNQQTELRAEAERLLELQSRLNEWSRQYQSEQTREQRLNANLTRDELIIKEIGDVHFDAGKYAALKKSIQDLEPAYLEYQRLNGYISREIPQTAQAIRQAEAAMAETGDLLKTHSEALKTLNFQEAEYLSAKTAFSGFDQAYTQQSATVRQVEKEGLEIQGALQRNQEKLLSNEQIKAQVQDKVEEAELLGKLYEHLGNFKTEILEKVSPGISREASDLFSRITRGKYESIQVDENFDFSIADGARFYPIERFSGGEVDLANFCLRIAITKAIMDLSGSDHRLEFLAFDEIFGSQDEERRVEMMLALNYLQEQFRQIYIISHIESLRDFFPHLLEVQSAPEGSSVAWR